MKTKFLTIVILFLFKVSFGQSYNYPVKPGSDKWKSLKTHDEMIEACQIPTTLIIKMNTSELLETCLNYPLLLDIYAFDNPKVGFDKMCKYFNGIDSLIKRQDVGLVILQKYKNINDSSLITINDDDVKKGTFTMNLSAFEILISNDIILNQLDKSKRIELLKEILIKNNHKDLHKDVYGTLGKITIGYLASKTLNYMKDQTWDLYLLNNQKAKLFSEKMILSDEKILNNIFINSQRIIKN